MPAVEIPAVPGILYMPMTDSRSRSDFSWFVATPIKMTISHSPTRTETMFVYNF